MRAVVESAAQDSADYCNGCPTCDGWPGGPPCAGPKPPGAVNATAANPCGDCDDYGAVHDFLCAPPTRRDGVETALANALNEVEDVFLDRHEKYGPGNIARSPGGPLNGLRVRLHDKLARINNYVDNDVQADFADDALRDAFIDIAGYALIGLLVQDGHWPGAETTQ